MNTDATTFGYRSSLDGLRAIAVALVVAFHLGHLQAGWIGVDLFFVLSGYLITGLLANEVTNGGIGLIDFWKRRLRRLVPGVILLLALVTVMTLVLPASFNEGTHLGDVFGHLFYVTNWVSIVGESSYWSTFQSPSLFKHSWSLAIEEQVYLVWPVALWLATRGRHPVAQRRAIGWIAGGGFLIFAGVQVSRSLAGASVEELYVGTHTRIAAFMLGAVCVLRFDRKISERVATISTAVGIGGLITASFVLRGQDPMTFRGPLLLAGFASAAAVTGAANLTCVSPFRRGLEWGPLRSIGRWSYGIYLYHWPLVVATRGWRNPWMRALVVTLISIALAAVSYRFVEQPIRRRSIRGRRMVVSCAGLSAAAFVGGLVVVPGPTISLETSYQPTLVVPALPPTIVAVPSVVPSVVTTDPGPEATVATTAPPPPPRPPVRIMLVGDSTAVRMAENLAETTSVRDHIIEVINGGQIGCPIVTTVAIRKIGIETDTAYCPKFRETWPELFDRFEPDVVMIVTSPSQAWEMKADANEGYFRLPEAKAVEYQDTEFAAMVALARARHLPILITDAPNLRGSLGEDESTRIAIDVVNGIFQRWDRTYPDVAVVPYAKYFRSLLTDEGSEQRPDGVHPSKQYMLDIADSQLIPEILKIYDRLAS